MPSLLRYAAGVLLALLLPLSAVAAPCAGFTDVDDSDLFCPNVTWMKNRSITLGCTTELYCPTAPVTRLAMAAFLNRLGKVLLPPNVVWVGHDGGQFQSIQAAIDHVASQPFNAPGLVKVAPGEYYEQLTIPSNVVVEGAGRRLTEIRAQGGCSPGPPTAGGVTLHGGAQLRNIHVSLATGASPQCAAVVIVDGDGIALHDVWVRVHGAASVAYGVRAISSAPLSLSLELENVDVRAYNDAAPAPVGYAISAEGGSDDVLVVRDAEVSAIGPNATGIHVASMSARIQRTNVMVLALWPSNATVALKVENLPLSPTEVLVQNSTLRASNVVDAVSRTGGGELRLATSLVQGALTGVTSCYGNYDATLAPVIC